MVKPWLMGCLGALAMGLTGCGADGGQKRPPADGVPDLPDAGGMHELPNFDSGVDDPRDDDAGTDASLPEDGHAAAIREVTEQTAALAGASAYAAQFSNPADPVLVLPADPCATIENATARLYEVTGSSEASGCVEVNETFCGDQDAYLFAVLTECALADTGMTLSGTVVISTQTDLNGDVPVVQLGFGFDPVTLISAGESYELTGEMFMRTSDLSEYSLLVLLKVNDSALSLSTAPSKPRGAMECESTPETSSVHVTTTVQIGEQETENEMDVTLPGECP